MAGSKEERPIEHDNRGQELEKKKNEWELLSAGTFLNEGEKEEDDKKEKKRKTYGWNEIKRNEK